jgi:hypothetical protein
MKNYENAKKNITVYFSAAFSVGEATLRNAQCHILIIGVLGI